MKACVNNFHVSSKRNTAKLMLINHWIPEKAFLARAPKGTMHEPRSRILQSSTRTSREHENHDPKHRNRSHDRLLEQNSEGITDLFGVRNKGVYRQ